MVKFPDSFLFALSLDLGFLFAAIIFINWNIYGWDNIALEFIVGNFISNLKTTVKCENDKVFPFNKRKYTPSSCYIYLRWIHFFLLFLVVSGINIFLNFYTNRRDDINNRCLNHNDFHMIKTIIDKMLLFKCRSFTCCNFL